MKRGFTLIELLIVVAIIAILAAIAVPNFLEAQTRSKTSRVKSDMRSLATGMEAYSVDYNAYPLCNNNMLPGWRPSSDGPANPHRTVLERVSSPVAYITQGIMRDPFDPPFRYQDHSVSNPQGTKVNVGSDGNKPLHSMIKYGATRRDSGSFADTVDLDGPAKMYFLYSSGPDRGYDAMAAIMQITEAGAISAQFYDPTNGTISYGDIWRPGSSAGPPGGTYGAEFYKQLLANHK
jgi:type II secretion system protein G